MNTYELKQQAKKERYLERAEKAEKLSAQYSETSRKMIECIPFGQPILVGHHSEKSDRSFRNRAWNKLGQSVKESEKAEYYKSKAESIGKGGISSDDPEAVKKLEEKLEGLEKSLAYAKEYNAKLRKFKTKANAIKEVEKLPEDDKDKKVYIKMLKQCDYYAYPPDRISAYYFNTSLTNAEIRRVKQRIEQLRKKEEMEVREDIKGDGWVITEDKEENRIKIIFDGKPELETRQFLKSHGFRWSPYNKAWQRMLNGNGRYAVKMIINKLK